MLGALTTQPWPLPALLTLDDSQGLETRDLILCTGMGLRGVFSLTELTGTSGQHSSAAALIERFPDRLSSLIPRPSTLVGEISPMFEEM